MMKKGEVFTIKNKYYVVISSKKDKICVRSIKNGIVDCSKTHVYNSDLEDLGEFGIEKKETLSLNVSAKNIKKAMSPYTEHTMITIPMTKQAIEFFDIKDEIQVLKLYNSNLGHTVFLKKFKVIIFTKTCWTGSETEIINFIRIKNISKC